MDRLSVGDQLANTFLKNHCIFFVHSNFKKVPLFLRSEKSLIKLRGTIYIISFFEIIFLVYLHFFYRELSFSLCCYFVHNMAFTIRFCCHWRQKNLLFFNISSRDTLYYEGSLFSYRAYVYITITVIIVFIIVILLLLILLLSILLMMILLL